MKYKRPQLLACYCEMQAKALSRLRNIDYETALKFVKEQVISKYKPMRGVIVKTASPGNTVTEDIDVLKYLESVNDKVIAPSGSVYRPTYEKQSHIANMITEKMAERKVLKKKQFKAANDGNHRLKLLYKYQQTSVKLSCNSLPGGFASPFNIMYDKGGYNSITSTARSMIGLAITTAEQLLGGNFSWFSEEELINFITLLLDNCPPEATVLKVAAKYRLKLVTAEELFQFYKELGQIYSPRCEFKIVQELLAKLKHHEIIFLYYYCNLRNIIWNNDTVFRGFIKHLFDCSKLKIKQGATTDELYSHDESVIVLVTVVFTNELGNKNIDDICADQQLLNKLVALCNMIEAKLSNLDELFNTFINIPIIAPCIHKKPSTLRNTVIISDTDSVIFTAAAWDTWYRGVRDEILHESYQITALVIYWLHNVVRYIMRQFSIVNCVAEENLNVLFMKNEFVYPIMMLYDIRKTYVGLIAVQEGNLLPSPTPDIKGQTLKGSMFCEKTRKFTEDFIKDSVLFKSMVGKLSAIDLISTIVNFENEISESIDTGSVEYFKITSIKHESEYKTPDSIAVVKAWRFWEYVMGQQYGSIMPPCKLQTFPSLPVTDEYLEWLKKYPKICKKFRKYITDIDELPNNLIINPLLNKVPEELIPLINKRSIIFHNVQPVYSVLERIGIALGFKKQELLFSDIYQPIQKVMT